MSSVTRAIDRGMRAMIERLHAAERAGAQRLGWKIAVNDPAAQRQIGIAAPLVGALRGDGVVEPGGTLSLCSGERLAVEAEIAIRIGRKLRPRPAPELAARAIASVGPAIEIVNYALPSDDLATIVEHSFFHAASVFGDEYSFDPELELATCLRQVRRNGEPVRDVDSALVPRSLGAVVSTIAMVLHAHGEALRPGDRILSGSLVQPVRARAGDVVSADFGAWGDLSVRFAPPS